MEHPGETKSCIWCGETIKAAARICRFCNREQAQARTEEVLFEGAGNMPIRQLATDILLSLICIGLPLLLWHWIENGYRKYRVTSKRIQFSSGIIDKKVEVLELYRVQDIQLRTTWGQSTLCLLAADKTTPAMEMTIPRAEEVFQKLQDAIAEARKESNVGVRETL